MVVNTLHQKFIRANFLPRLFSALFMLPAALVIIYLGGYAYISTIIILMMIMFWEWWKMTKIRHNAPLTILGYIYIAICLLALGYLRFMENGLLIILWLFATIAITDTTAYLFGVSIGGKKLCPRISPGKTWSGFLGGILCAGLASYLCFSSVQFAIAAVLLGISGQGGDLLESAAKRYYGVKDSSNLIPGHGGFLDRLDALLPASFITLVMIQLWK